MTKHVTETSVLDFFVVCDKILPFIKSMVIDEQRAHVLTNFHPSKLRGKAIESDHNTEIMELELCYQKRKQERTELFNFKNEECQKAFFNLTSETTKLSECFQDDDQPFEKQARKWEKTLDDIFHQTFKKIRVTETKPKQTEVTVLLEKRKMTKIEISKCDDNEEKEALEDTLNMLDKDIALKCEDENRQKIFENFAAFSDVSGYSPSPVKTVVPQHVCAPIAT